MTTDPTDPDTFEDDEEGEPLVIDDVEAPEADAAEQHAELLQHRDSPLVERDLTEVNHADAAEQARVVAYDDEDHYR